MNYFFISKRVHAFFLVCILIFYINSWWSFLCYFFVVYLSLLFIYRRKNHRRQLDSNRILLPITGKLEKITDEIWKIKHSWWKGKEVVAPIDATVSQVQIGKGFSQIEFQTDNQNLIKILFLTGGYSYPHLIISKNDQVKAGATLGYLPSIATLFLYLPQKYEILNR